MKYNPLPPLEELKEFLDYNPDTGIVTWIKARGKRSDLVGKEVGCIDKQGYREFRFNGVLYFINRIAYYMYHSEDPPCGVDHQDRNKSNNKIDNLRLATTSQNAMNKAVHKNNKSSATGVYWHKKNKRWSASICLNGKSIWLGSFTNKEDAIQARIEAEKKYFGEFRRGL